MVLEYKLPEYLSLSVSSTGPKTVLRIQSGILLSSRTPCNRRWIRNGNINLGLMVPALTPRKSLAEKKFRLFVSVGATASSTKDVPFYFTSGVVYSLTREIEVIRLA